MQVHTTILESWLFDIFSFCQNQRSLTAFAPTQIFTKFIFLFSIVYHFIFTTDLCVKKIFKSEEAYSYIAALRILTLFSYNNNRMLINFGVCGPCERMPVAPEGERKTPFKLKKGISCDKTHCCQA